MEGQEVAVVYARKRDAKRVKSALEEAQLLDRNFRMVSSTISAEETIALPVIEPFVMDSRWKEVLVGQGRQFCPFSTKIMGRSGRTSLPPNLTAVEAAMFLTVQALTDTQGMHEPIDNPQSILQNLHDLGLKYCPPKLEIFGDDRTVVIPPRAFTEDFWERFDSLVSSYSTSTTVMGVNDASDDDFRIKKTFWKNLANTHGSSRIVRRGTIDPDSHIRHSGHRLIYPHEGIPDTTGPESPGWIQVTEQGIKQSFDLTRVMFSRGNISEKIRFGKLVRAGEEILDMYAGIGYYTLPALIHGKAKHVVACEWNKDAIYALRYNVKQNKLAQQVTILEGDCRQSIKEHSLLGRFDRVSLGLLPSSEGGWESAILALNDTKGGWLHIHGNVPDTEKEGWALWTCRRLIDFCERNGKSEVWVALCIHLERVKSYAPTVSHFVADIFVGPASNHEGAENLPPGDRAGVCMGDGWKTSGKSDDILIPSCALSAHGPLYQSWMM